MKFLIALTVALLAVGAFALTDEQKEKEDGHAKVCIKETGVDPNVVADLKKGDFSNQDEPTQCFAKCMFEKAGFLDAEGNFNVELAKTTLVKNDNKEQVEKAIDECVALTGKNPCESAYKKYECYFVKKNASA